MPPPILEDLTPPETLRCEAFIRLTRIEIGLRRLIEAMLPTTVGSKWVAALPRDIQEKVQDNSLDGVDFPDLKKIVSAKWSYLSELHSSARKERLVVHLEELEPIRNDIAHSRWITVADLALVDGTYYMILDAIRAYIHPAPSEPTAASPSALLRVRHQLAACQPLDRDVPSLSLPSLVAGEDANRLEEALLNYQRIRTRPGHSRQDVVSSRDFAATLLDPVLQIAGLPPA